MPSSPVKPSEEEARPSLQHYIDYYKRSPDLDRYQRPRLPLLKRESIKMYLDEVAEKAQTCRAILGSVSGGIACLKQAAADAPLGRAEALAHAIRDDARLAKHTQLAVVRFDDASESLLAIEQYMSETRRAMTDPAIKTFAGCPIDKLQGKVFSLCNLHRLFEDHPAVARLFLERRPNPRGLLDVTA
jgi:hypothetical protein